MKKIEMTEIELKYYILKNPGSDLAKAYAMGLKDKSLELSKGIERIFNNLSYKKGHYENQKPLSD